jgi:hypothetical protein
MRNLICIHVLWDDTRLRVLRKREWWPLNCGVYCEGHAASNERGRPICEKRGRGLLNSRSYVSSEQLDKSRKTRVNYLKDDTDLNYTLFVTGERFMISSWRNSHAFTIKACSLYVLTQMAALCAKLCHLKDKDMPQSTVLTLHGSKLHRKYGSEECRFERIESNLNSSLTSSTVSRYRWGKAIPLQAWTDSEGSRRLRLPEFLDNRHIKVVSQPYTPSAFTPKEVFLVLVSVIGWVDPRAIVRP